MAHSGARLTGADTLDERLNAVDSAIELSPLEGEAHDLKAQLLLEKGSIDAAKQACDPPQFGGNPPVELRGRKAWILAQNKQMRDAIIEMKEILETNKNYYWGWRQLVTWQSKSKSPVDYLQTAQEMVRQFPHDDVARNHLSSAQTQNKDSKTAKQTLLDAVNLAPDNAFALTKLFDAQIKENELAAAGKTLDLIQRHMSSSEFLHRQVILAAKLNDAQTAEQGLGQLCTAEHFEINALTAAAGGMDTAKMQDRVNAVLNLSAVMHQAAVMHQSGAHPDPPAGVVGFWMQRAAKSLQWKACQKILDRFEPASPQWLEAAVIYLDKSTKAKKYALANRFIRRQLKRPDLPTRLWGQIGFSLYAQEKPTAVIKAMRDWPDRADAQPWMLLNLAHATRRLNRFAQANQIQTRAVALKADHTTLKHRIWLALDEVIAGQAGEQVKKINAAQTSNQTSKMDQHYPYLLNLIRALQPISNPGAKPTPEACKTARKAVSAAADTFPGWKNRREPRLAMRRSVGRVVAVDPSLFNRLWQMRWFVQTALATKR